MPPICRSTLLPSGFLHSRCGKQRRQPPVSRSRLCVKATEMHDFDMPELEGSVEYYQRQLGASFNAEGYAVSFRDKFDAGSVSSSSSLLFDRSSWGRFRVEGSGTLDFLHNKTTQSFADLIPGQGCDTVFCTSKGRINDLVTAYVQRDAAFVITSPNKQDALIAELDKFIFPGDHVQFVDMRSRVRVFSLTGQSTRFLLELLNIDLHVLDGPYGHHHVLGFKHAPVIVAKGSEIDRIHGYTLIVDEALSGDLYKNLIDAGAVPIGIDEWERLRIAYGRPCARYEFPTAGNPFEVNLFEAVSLNKGCFVGQESISRIYSKNLIRRRLWAIELPLTAVSAIPSNQPIWFKDDSSDIEVGVVTSPPVLHPEKEMSLALCLLRTKLRKNEIDWEGMTVRVADVEGVICRRPYMTYDFVDSNKAPSNAMQSTSSTSQINATAKEEKLKAMQARLAAFMDKHGKEQR